MMPLRIYKHPTGQHTPFVGAGLGPARPGARPPLRFAEHIVGVVQLRRVVQDERLVGLPLHRLVLEGLPRALVLQKRTYLILPNQFCP